ncbi:MAG: FtsK/SpoIIIE domain-containing protein, partial [Turicibacter sp.]|nr:FtsK/SpoIIIE domain-containing protein [Turicibacter sp.]
MNNHDIKKRANITPGVYATGSASSLKSIANKSPEAYSNNVPEITEADLKRKNAEADMAASPFRAQPFISPITGKKESSSNVHVMMAHGIYDKSAGKVIDLKDPILLTEEAMANATFTVTSDVAKILAENADEKIVSVPIQGRLVFSTLEGEFEIAANLVRVRLEESDVYAQYDRTLHDVLDEQFGKFKGPKPFTRVGSALAKHENVDVALGMTTVLDDGDEAQKVPVATEQEVVTNGESGSTFSMSVQMKEDERVEAKKSFPSDFYYDVPSLDLLEDSQPRQTDDDEWVQQKMAILEATFENFGVAVTVTGNYIQGATVTQFEIMPAPGTKVSRIVSLANDLKLSLSVDDLRIEQMQGKSTIGIEIANETRRVVRLKDVLSSPEFVLHESPLYIGLGEDIKGASVYADILTMPHGLIAGQTGSGKSVCINTILVSILCKAKPDDVRLMLIDPKRVEMAPYNDIPHLVTPVITDEKKAATALAWAVDEMEHRYELFAKNGVRDIKTFNRKRHSFASSHEQLPYIVIIIDELAD